jgi:predicted ATP-dependent endonuclease of OLD family
MSQNSARQGDDMLIKQIVVRHFRAIRDQLVSCSNLTALVGRNGSGKSSFLHAIDVFYDPAAPVSEEDFFAHDLDSPIEIQVSFGKLREEEYSEFRPYIKDDQLIVTKRISFENGRVIQRYYAAALQIPVFADVRAISGKREKIAAWNSLIGSGKLPDLEAKAKSADDVDRLMREYEERHPDLLCTLAIQKRSSEVWNLLAAVKTEWTKYGDILDAVQKKLHQASDTIEKAKARSRAVGRKLKDVQELPVGETTTLLPPSLMEDDREAMEGENGDGAGD